MTLEHRDDFFMRQAIEIGELGRTTAPPNPWVGCVIVKNDHIVGSGFTEPAGGRHAEIVALEMAGEAANGATAYVTLEPCSHYGRTPPCVNAIKKASISKVVTALVDPDEKVSGRGIEMLRASGIEVDVGVQESAAATSLAPYLHQRRTGLPYNVLKMAISIDGRSAAADGSSKWISSEAARTDAHRLRAESQAILVGCGTVLADNPQLTIRSAEIPNNRQPLRIVVDSHGRISAPCNLMNTAEAPTLMATTQACPKDTLLFWGEQGVRYVVLPADDNGQVALGSLMQMLTEEGIIQVLVEGGSTLHGKMLSTGLWNKLIVYQGACLLGDHGAAAVKGVFIPSIEQAPRLVLSDVASFDSTVRMSYTKGY